MNKTMNNLLIFAFGRKYNSAIDWALLLLRVTVGAFMLTHGLQKLSNFEMLKSSFPDPIGFGSTFALSLIIFAEVFCSILLIVGLLSRLASIPLIIAMSVAAFVAHSADPFAVKEMALIYLLIYVVILLAGPGKYSIDNVLQNFVSRKLPLE